MSEVTKFRIHITHYRAPEDSWSSHTDKFEMGIPELALLMNAYLNKEEWICIEDLEKSKKTKKKVGWAAEHKNIRNIDIYPVLPKRDKEDDDDND